MGARIEMIMPEAYSTVDALKSVREKITTDFFVVPCDVLTDFPLQTLMDSFRMNDPALLSLFVSTATHEYVGASLKVHDDVTLVGMDDMNERLVMLDFKENLSDPYEHVDIYMPLLDELGTVNVYSQLIDSHVYLMKRWMLDWIFELTEMDDSVESIKMICYHC